MLSFSIFGVRVEGEGGGVVIILKISQGDGRRLLYFIITMISIMLMVDGEIDAWKMMMMMMMMG